MLPRVQAGEPVGYRPPEWATHQREGSVEISSDREFLIVEGVGASQPFVLDLVDVVDWVETDKPTRLGRDLVRDAPAEISPSDCT